MTRAVQHESLHVVLLGRLSVMTTCLLSFKNHRYSLFSNHDTSCHVSCSTYILRLAMVFMVPPPFWGGAISLSMNCAYRSSITPLYLDFLPICAAVIFHTYFPFCYNHFLWSIPFSSATYHFAATTLEQVLWNLLQPLYRLGSRPFILSRLLFNSCRRFYKCYTARVSNSQRAITLNSTTFCNCYTAHVSNLQTEITLNSTTFSKLYTARVSNLQGEITLNSTTFSKRYTARVSNLQREVMLYSTTFSP